MPLEVTTTRRCNVQGWWIERTLAFRQFDLTGGVGSGNERAVVSSYEDRGSSIEIDEPAKLCFLPSQYQYVGVEIAGSNACKRCPLPGVDAG